MLMKKELANGKKTKQGGKIQRGRRTSPPLSHDFADFSAVVCVAWFRNLGQSDSVPDTTV